MELIAPDILADANGLSPVLYVIGLLSGLALWLLGWRWHRFWVVLAVTLVGGTYGLTAGPKLHTHPLVAGVLLALAAGLLALALARLLAFVSGGVLAVLAIHLLVPSWEHHLLSFLGGGLLAVLLFRIWITALTSLGGALLLAYCSLCLAESFAILDVVDFAGKHSGLLNWICSGAALCGLLLQLLLGRRHPTRGSQAKSGSGSKSKGDDHESSSDRGWLSWVVPPQRKAG